MIEIIIDKEEEKKTIGVIENGKLIEVYEENKENKHERNEGNIYVGIVKDIIPGMQAAFIDIGTEKNSFIHVRDIMPQIDEKIERKEEKTEDLIEKMAKLIIEQNSATIGRDVAKAAEKKIDDEATARKSKKEGGTKENVQEKTKRRTTKTA